MKKSISRIVRVAKTDFVKVSVWTGMSTVIRMIAGFVSIKVVAKIIGPSGIALMGQLINSITLIGAFSTGFIGQGVTKYVAENYDDTAKQKKIIGNAFQITLLSTIATSIIVLVFYQQIAFFVFQSTEYSELVIYLALSLCLYSFNALLLSILNGLKLFRKFTIINIVISLATLALSLILVIWKGLYGAFLNCILSQAVIVLITIIYVRKETWFKWVFSKRDIDWTIIKRLSGFIVMTIVASMISPYVQIFIRQQITNQVSLDAAGLWEGMNRISGMYLLLVTTSITTYYLPRLSEIRETHILKHEIRKTAIIVLPVLCILCFLIFLFRDLVITILFSHKFQGMSELFAPQMIGDFLRVASWLIAMLFWAKAMTKTFIITEISFNILYIILVKIMIQQFGLVGASYAYAFTYLLYLILMLALFKRILFHGKTQQ